MIIDARRDTPRRPLECDLCVIGAGAAGLTLATQLESPRRLICVLESGGRVISHTTQALLAGESDANYPPLQTTRAAALGGSTQVWSGWCRPLDANDFEHRVKIPHSGWPIKSAELQPYYVQAHEILQLGPYDYDPATWERVSGSTRWPLLEEQIATLLFRQSPVRFGSAFAPELRKSAGIRIYLHANVLRLEYSAQGNAVAAVEAVTLNGQKFEVRPRLTVLAAGGIENARLLLLSNRPGRELGHVRSPIGRYFTEHGFVDGAIFVPAHSNQMPRLYLQQRVLERQARQIDGEPGAPRVARAALAVAAARQRKEGLLNCAIYFRPAYESHSAFDSPRVQALLQAWDMLKGRAVPYRMLSRLAYAAGAPHALACAMFSKRRAELHVPAHWRLRALFECAPDPDNRIELAEACDRLGRPLVRLYWRLRHIDLSSVVRTHALLDEALRRAQLGYLRLRNEQTQEWQSSVEPGKHHMGTTRMHDDPARGVVDRDCRVHGVENLFIAGSSVFPSAGFANPTLTIVALSLRLAAYLRAQRAGALQ
jgi:choline dehydrogenase-like flavoprotein